MDCISRAALYIRVSTEEQATEGQSVSAQIETLKQYCTLYNIEIVNIYKDLGISGKETKNRPGLANLLRDARESKFNIVLVWKISRLSRNLKDLLFILDEFEKLNIVFSSYSEKFDTSTPVGKMTLQLLGSIAEFERNTIIDNVKLGLNEFARKGGKTGTVLGYDNVDKHLSINTDEAKIVKKIFHLYVNRQMSFSQIADELNFLGCKTKRNNKFTRDSIEVILSNPVYIGINRHNVGQQNEFTTKGSHEPIIDAATWSIAQNLKSSDMQHRSKRNNKHNFLFSGKILCPSCSSTMYGFTSKAGTKTYRYYRCRTCKIICNAEHIEFEATHQLKELFNSKDYFSKALIDCSTANDSIDISIVKREYEKTQKLMDKYIMLIDCKEFNSSEVILSKIKELESRLKELQTIYEDLVENSNSAPAPELDKTICLKDFSQVFEENNIDEIRTLISRHVKFITLYPNKTFKEISLNQE